MIELTEDNFAAMLSKPLIILFWAKWDDKSMKLRSELIKISYRYPNVNLCCVDVMRRDWFYYELTKICNIQIISTLVAIKDESIIGITTNCSSQIIDNTCKLIKYEK